MLEAGWDLVVFDEAHKLSAHYYGSKLEKTARFRLAERVGERTRHLLLMTATPHNGKEEDFQLFLSLLDSDRFYNTPLFPERKAYTVNYKLSEIEAALAFGAGTLGDALQGGKNLASLTRSREAITVQSAKQGTVSVPVRESDKADNACNTS